MCVGTRQPIHFHSRIHNSLSCDQCQVEEEVRYLWNERTTSNAKTAHHSDQTDGHNMVYDYRIVIEIWVSIYSVPTKYH